MVLIIYTENESDQYIQRYDSKKMDGQTGGIMIG